MRGFSLFTPLVGTALVVMSILVATTLIENDIRFSRSITNSFAVSSQAMGAKLITAAATMRIVDNIQTVIYEEFERGYEIPCSIDCLERTKNTLIDTLHSQIISEAFYNNFTRTIKETTGYTPISDCGCRELDPLDNADCCLAQAMADTPTAVDIRFDSMGRLVVTIKSQPLQRDEFVVGFTDGVNTLRLSIAPKSDLPVKIDEDINGMIERAVDAFINDRDDISGPRVSWDKHEGKAVFEFENGRKLRLKFSS